MIVFELSGQFGYEWIEIQNLFKSLNISKYKIRQEIDKKNHKNSKIKINGKEVAKLKPIFVDFGLDRKTEQFKSIEDHIESKK